MKNPWAWVAIAAVVILLCCGLCFGGFLLFRGLRMFRNFQLFRRFRGVDAPSTQWVAGLPGLDVPLEADMSLALTWDIKSALE